MDNKKIIYSLLGLTAAAVLLIYWQTLDYGFLRWDTHLQITQNDDIRSLSLGAIKTFFSSFYLAMYQPLATLTYALEYKITGLSGTIYHFNNILLHLANITLVYIFVSKTSRQRFIGWLAAALFAVHPIMVESVAWLSARSNLLYTFFYLLGLIIYLRYIKTRKIGWLIAVAVAFLLSLSAKISAISMPFLLLGLDWLKEGKIKTKQIIEKIILLVFSVPFVLAAFFARKPYEQYSGFPENLTWLDNIFLNFYSLLFYPFKLLLPSELSPLYAYPESLTWYHYAAPITVLAIILLAIKFLKGRRLLAFGLIFYALTILPMLKTIPIGAQHTADRYVYLPALGIFIFITALAYTIFNQKLKSKLLKILCLLLLTIWLLSLAILSYMQTWYWQNDLTLAQAMLKNNQNNPVALKFKGNALANSQAYEEAISYYNQALELEPNYPEVMNAKATAIMSGFQDYEQALPILIQATRLEPNNPIIHFNLGIAWMHLQEYNEALRQFNLASQIKNPKIYPMSQIERLHILLNRGHILLELGRPAEALQDFQNIAIPSVSGLWQAKAYLELDQNETACGLLTNLEQLEAINLYEKNCTNN